ncbi:response regulator [Blastopirellula sp. JC732]|uniref:Response regulator n=1 Tax=Blastopirellula sediminis TaxID=2894196 RepID=A0A9X1MMP6_9BACT|nr:response regulator [Blastopirellula sediminis]MCC9607091.1 response regulator [Blastopirellula sediminis]MCC9629616.1 response regulator [Blastopirellula sediminis]
MGIVQTPNLLITDDDRGFRETLAEVFAARGFQTHLAKDGMEAIDVVRSTRIDVALFDYHMPRKTGLEAIVECRTAVSQLPCILLSGNLDEMIRQQAISAQVFSILSKPVSLPDITSKVREALQQRFPERYGSPEN